MTLHFIDELRWRGLIQDISDETAVRALPPGTPFYVGFDPTAPSLQIGNLIPLIVTMHLGRWGLKPIILFGGATGSIGDPSGRNSERQLLEQSVIEKNVATQVTQVKELFGRMGVTPQFVNNHDWTKGMDILTFLRDVGKHLTVNYMIAKEVVKTRLEGDGIPFTEFSYMLLQAHDFLHLYENKGCRLQIGGSDQWGNLTAGLELIRKKIQGDAVAFSWPLLTNSQGKKFGKSEGGALWLDPKMTSPYKLHQYWLNVDDADVMKGLRVFSFFDEAKLAEVEAALKAAPEKREAQKLLADTVCTLIHGEAATADAKKSAAVLFGGSIEGLTEAQLLDIFAEVPSSSVTRAQAQEVSILDLFANSGIVKSKGEVRRLVESGGAYINNERIPNGAAKLGETPWAGASLLVLRTGKKNYHLVRIC